MWDNASYSCKNAIFPALLNIISQTNQSESEKNVQLMHKGKGVYVSHIVLLVNEIVRMLA